MKSPLSPPLFESTSSVKRAPPNPTAAREGGAAAGALPVEFHMETGAF